MKNSMKALIKMLKNPFKTSFSSILSTIVSIFRPKWQAMCCQYKGNKKTRAIARVFLFSKVSHALSGSRRC